MGAGHYRPLVFLHLLDLPMAILKLEKLQIKSEHHSSMASLGRVASNQVVVIPECQVPEPCLLEGRQSDVLGST